MINRNTSTARRRSHTPVIYWTVPAHNVTKRTKRKKILLKLRVLLVYLGFTTGAAEKLCVRFYRNGGTAFSKTCNRIIQDNVKVGFLLNIELIVYPLTRVIASQFISIDQNTISLS